MGVCGYGAGARIRFWVVEVEVAADKTNKLGMVHDFGSLRETLRGILPDHAALILFVHLDGVVGLG